MRKGSLIAVTVGFAAVTAACGSSGCLENGSTLPLAGLYSSYTGAQISIDSLEVRGIGAPNDSVLIVPTRNTRSIYLPFRADYESVSWVFSVHQSAVYYPELYDTITFGYETIPYFASADCGAMYVYRLNRIAYTTHLIDSVTVTDSLFTNVDREQIKIFYRAAEE